MDSINDIISSLSGDDIEMLKGVASSILGGNQQSDQAPTEKPPTEKPQPQQQNNSHLSNLGLSISDFDMILKAKNIFEKMNSTSSKNADLIVALKPHLSPDSQNKADQAIKMLQLFEILPYLKELF